MVSTVAEKASVNQQKKLVEGTVTDASGEPIIGANVVEKGTTNGTITDLNGKFSLEITPGALLQVSYIGYNTRISRLAAINLFWQLIYQKIHKQSMKSSL